MVSDGKLINTPRKGLDSYYVEDTQLVEDTCCEDIDFQKNSAPIVTDSLPSLNISVKTQKLITVNITVLREILPRFHSNKL